MKRIRTTIVIPKDLHLDVKIAAVEEHRSFNKQVIHWLQFMVSQRKARFPHWWQTGYEYDGSWMVEEEE
jgi:hypothetical protein